MIDSNKQLPTKGKTVQVFFPWFGSVKNRKCQLVIRWLVFSWRNSFWTFKNHWRARWHPTGWLGSYTLPVQNTLWKDIEQGTAIVKINQARPNQRTFAKRRLARWLELPD